MVPRRLCGMMFQGITVHRCSVALEQCADRAVFCRGVGFHRSLVACELKKNAMPLVTQVKRMILAIRKLGFLVNTATWVARCASSGG